MGPSCIKSARHILYAALSFAPYSNNWLYVLGDIMFCKAHSGAHKPQENYTVRGGRCLSSRADIRQYIICHELSFAYLRIRPYRELHWLFKEKMIRTHKKSEILSDLANFELVWKARWKGKGLSALIEAVRHEKYMRVTKTNHFLTTLSNHLFAI